MGFLRGGEVVGEVEVVDALPGLVGRAPGASCAEVVETGGAVAVVRVGLDVVARVVRDPATVAAVQVEEVRAGDDDVVALRGEVGDVGEAEVPSLKSNGFREGVCVGGGEEDVFPHDQFAVGDGLEDWHGGVDPVLGKVVICA